VTIIKFPVKPSPGFLFKSAGIGICLFWLVGVWFLPEKALILKYFRGYIALAFCTTLLGAFIFEKSGAITKKIGLLFLSLGFGFIGAFFAMCSYLVFISI
jgi:hypothetical protein